MIHELKILPQYFKEVKEGNKTFELRKNDRGFEVGDTLVLEEYENGHYTGENIKKEISYILADAQFYGLKEGYCILGLKQEGIILKNIDLTGISMKDQNYKISEEEQEFIDSFNDYLTYHTFANRNHLVEELWDTFQAKLGLLEKVGIPADEVQEYYPIWVKKLKNRPREKKCSKCINCEKEEYTSGKSVLICHQNEFTVYDDFAIDCRCYEEKEE